MGRRVYVLVLLVTVVPLVLVIALVCSTLLRLLTDRAGAQVSSVSNLSARLLDERFLRLRDLTSSLATRVHFRQLVAEGKWSEAIPILGDIPSDFPFVDRIILADTTGVLRADIPAAPEVLGEDFSYRDWYQGAIRQGVYVSEVYHRKAAPPANVLASACLIHFEGRPVGTLVLQVKLTTLLEWCEEVEVGRSGFVYVVDHHGHLAAHPRVHPEQEILDVSRLLRGVSGEGGVNIGEDPITREECLTSTTTVRSTGWRVVAALPTAEAFAERKAELRRLLVRYGLLLLASAILTWLLLRALAARDRALAQVRVEGGAGGLASAALLPTPGALRAANVIVWAAAGLCMAAGSVVLMGWALDLPLFKSPSPRWVNVKANTALALIMAGLSLAAHRRRTRAAAVLGALAAAVTLAMGGLSFVEYAAGVDLHIDQALFQEAPGAVGTSSPGRMAPGTALCFFMSGSALILGRLRGRAAAATVPALSGGVLLVGGMTVIGYLYGVPALTGHPSFTVMALYTGAAFFALGLGLLCAHPEMSPMRVVLGGTLGGLQVRKLLLPLIGVPLLLGWLRIEGERAGLVDVTYGVALLVLACMIVLLAVLLWTAVGLARVDEARLRGLAALEAANRELESFSYSVSHDLRAPLRAVLGFGQALEEDCGGLLDEVGREHLRRVRGEAERMGTLIDDLLRLSRVARAQMRIEEVDLAAIAREVVEGLRRAEPGRQVEVVVPLTLPARGDAALLHVVVQNLLENAWKFTSRRPRARIEVGRELLDGETAYYVRDDGDGFDPKYAHKLFGAFQRLHGEGEFPGTGVGLATVQRVILRHGGRIWAEGKPGEGATFRFVLGART